MVYIRSQYKTKKTIFNIVSVIMEASEQGLAREFVEKVLYSTLRHPKMPLPHNIEETMHMI
jgi:hypothetical protein